MIKKKGIVFSALESSKKPINRFRPLLFFIPTILLTLKFFRTKKSESFES